MKQMRASTFKAHCLKVMNQVRATGEAMVITKRGVPLVKVIPVEPQEPDLFGFMAGEFVIAGDIESSPLPLKQRKVVQK